MTSDTLQLLIATRLEDFATRVETLIAEGRNEDAECLRKEGLALAESYDREETFLVLGNFTEV